MVTKGIQETNAKLKHEGLDLKDEWTVGTIESVKLGRDVCQEPSEMEIPVRAVFAQGDMTDIIGVTKGNDFKGMTSRWHKRKLPRKTRKGLRKGAYIDVWHPSRIKKFYRIGAWYYMNNGKLIKNNTMRLPSKAMKDILDNMSLKAFKKLLGLKADYRAAIGSDWKPGAVPAKQAVPAKVAITDMSDGGSSDSAGKMEAQENHIMQLKEPKEEIDAAVKNLLELKAEHMTAKKHLEISSRYFTLEKQKQKAEADIKEKPVEKSLKDACATVEDDNHTITEEVEVKGGVVALAKKFEFKKSTLKTFEFKKPSFKKSEFKKPKVKQVGWDYMVNELSDLIGKETSVADAEQSYSEDYADQSFEKYYAKESYPEDFIMGVMNMNLF